MNKKKFLLSLVLLVAEQLFAVGELRLITVSADGTETTYALPNVQKIVFENDSMTVKMKSGPDATGITCIKFLLSDNSRIENLKQASKIFIFPNPVKTNLKVAGTEKDVKINLIDLNGKLLQSVSAQDNSTDIDVSALSPGLYLLQIGEKSIKFIKQ